MPSTTTSIRLTAEDLRVLDEACEILGADSRVEAVRLMAHTVVEASRAKASKKAAKKTAPKKTAAKKAATRKTGKT